MRRLQLFVLAVSLAAVPAWAGTREQAIELADKAATEYNLGHYAEAAGYYEDAYRLTKEPQLLFNLGQCYRLQGYLEKALTSYRAYLRTAPATAPNLDLADRRVREIEQTLADKKAPVAPAATSEPVPAPQTTLGLAAPPPPEPASRAATPAVAIGETSPPAVAESPAFYTRWWFWTGATVVVAGAVATALLVTRGTQGPLPGNTQPGLVVVR